MVEAIRGQRARTTGVHCRPRARDHVHQKRRRGRSSAERPCPLRSPLGGGREIRREPPRSACRLDDHGFCFGLMRGPRARAGLDPLTRACSRGEGGDASDCALRRALQGRPSGAEGFRGLPRMSSPPYRPHARAARNGAGESTRQLRSSGQGGRSGAYEEYKTGRRGPEAAAEQPSRAAHACGAQELQAERLPGSRFDAARDALRRLGGRGSPVSGFRPLKGSSTRFPPAVPTARRLGGSAGAARTATRSRLLAPGGRRHHGATSAWEIIARSLAARYRRSAIDAA